MDNFDSKFEEIDGLLNDLRNIVIAADGGPSGFGGVRLFYKDEFTLKDIESFLDNLKTKLSLKTYDYRNFKPTRNPSFNTKG